MNKPTKEEINRALQSAVAQTSRDLEALFGVRVGVTIVGWVQDADRNPIMGADITPDLVRDVLAIAVSQLSGGSYTVEGIFPHPRGGKPN